MDKMCNIRLRAVQRDSLVKIERERKKKLLYIYRYKVGIEQSTRCMVLCSEIQHFNFFLLLLSIIYSRCILWAKKKSESRERMKQRKKNSSNFGAFCAWRRRAFNFNGLCYVWLCLLLLTAKLCIWHRVYGVFFLFSSRCSLVTLTYMYSTLCARAYLLFYFLVSL